MMFDPPDFPYKELSETLRDHYDAGDLFSNDISNNSVTSVCEPPDVTDHIVNNIENRLSLHSNISGRYFNIENASFVDINTDSVNQNPELYMVQPDIFNFEPTLLDDSIVNQFLLPPQASTENEKEIENGPDLLALHSCAVCLEIFTTETDLLDHMISQHASENSEEMDKKGSADQNFEAEWLVCRLCERVLSTALETEPNEQLCCDDGSGKLNVATRKLNSMYVCDCCSYLFADGDALDRHRLICYIGQLNAEMSTSLISELLDSCNNEGSALSDENSAICSLACQRPTQMRQIRRTYSSTTTNKMWNCGSCNQLFATARDLYRHKRGEDRPPGAPLMAYVCEECDKVFGSMCALHTHKKMHRVTKPGYPCRVCGRRFNQSGHLAIHMRMHTGERPYPCDLCPKAFKVKVERDDHRRTHTGERPFACTACPKTFTAAARLREHARIHTDQRPYRCDICGAAFRRPYARTVHTLIHSGEKPHKCDVCGTAFRRSGDMWKHKRTLHGLPATNTM
ncbi:zinc finger protein 311-like [Battus philenor]|uniref:zinc finger protein 311-like n=1 Tax=Battus philenor TaxID=42288 RepID=UPI0035D0D40A